MINFKNKNIKEERETEIRYLSYISSTSFTYKDAIKHLRNVVQKIMSNNEHCVQYLNEIVDTNIILYRPASSNGIGYSYSEYYVSLIVKRTYYKDMYISSYVFSKALEQTEIHI